MADYYPVIARAVSRLPSKTDEARHSIYERARTALQENLRTHDPPVSPAELAIEQFALEAAISRVETELRRGAREETTLSSSGLSFISKVEEFVRWAREKLDLNISIIRSLNWKENWKETTVLIVLILAASVAGYSLPS